MVKSFKSARLMMTCLVFIFMMVMGDVNANEYEQDIAEFFTNLDAGDVDKAIDELYQSNAYTARLPDLLDNLKSQLRSLPNIVGQAHYIEEIDTYTVGSNLVQVTYVGTYDRQPLRFEFQFFKVPEGWRIYSLSFDDKIFTDIKEQARLSYMPPK